MVSSVVSLLDYIYLRFHLHPHHTIFSSCHGRFLLAGLDSHLALVGIPLSAYLSARLGVAPRVTLEIQPVLLETRGRHLFVCLVCHGRERERERKKERKKEREKDCLTLFFFFYLLSASSFLFFRICQKFLFNQSIAQFSILNYNK